MVAIVSGNSLGLDLTSLRTLGPQEFTGSAAHGRNGQGVYVNASNGNLVVQGLDGLVVAKGGDIAALRTYNSQGLLDDDNQDNWTNGFTPVPLRLAGVAGQSGSAVWRTGRDGAVAKYDWVGGKVYRTTAGDGAHDTLELTDGDTRFTWRDGATDAVQVYEASGSYRLLSSGDAEGNTVTYGYDAQGRVVQALDAGGRGTVYAYEGGNLTEMRTVGGGADLLRVKYQYDAGGRLARVSVDLSPDPAGTEAPMGDGDLYWTNYTYDANSPHRLVAIRQKDGTNLDFSYTAEGKVACVTDALGGSTSFVYEGQLTHVTDAEGRVTTYQKDAQGQLRSITAPASDGVAPKRTFSYDAQGNVIAVTDGQGRQVRFAYDVHGNQERQEDDAGGLVERVFSGPGQMVSETVLLQADPDGTGPLQATQAVTRQAWNPDVEGQLRFHVSAQGRVTEYRHDAAGLHVSTIVYGGRYTGTTPAIALATLQNWAQGQAAIQRVDMAYDARGELQSRTTYAEFDANGAGVAATQSTEWFIHDQAGRLLQSLTATGERTTYTYDGLGRVETVTDALGQTTVTDYQDSNRKTVHTLAYGLVRTEVYDAAGRLVATSASGEGLAAPVTTRYSYDASGRLRMTQDPTERRSWIFYTAAGQKAAEVDADGSMKEWSYDASGRVVSMRTYAKAVDLARLPALDGTRVPDQLPVDVRPAATNADHCVWYAYDEAGRLARTAETIGTGSDVAVTERRYDKASRLEREIRYATAQPLGSAAIPLPPAAQGDRVSRYFHDADGLLRGTLDGAGYLVEQRYDNAGRLTQRIAYARSTPEALREAGTLADLQPADSPKDVRTYYFHDGHGRRIGEMDGERYLSVHEYDADGRLTRTLRYLQPVAGTITTLEAARALAGQARVQASYAYDALGRLVTQQDLHATVTRNVYDTAGNLRSTTRAFGTSEARTGAARHDILGRVIQELAPEHQALIRATMTDAEKEAVWVQYATAHTYDAAGRRTSTTDPLGRRTLFYYGADGALAYTVDALGRVRERAYDARGRLVEETERLGRISTFNLNGGTVSQLLLDRLAAADQADDFSTRYAYTRDGRVSVVTSPTGNNTTTAYNAFGEVDTRIQGMGGTGPDRVERSTYDARGLLVKSERDTETAPVTQELVRDAFGRVVSTTDAMKFVRTQAYDRLGRVVETIDALGRDRATTYDAFNRVLTQRDALEQVTTFVYDDALRTVTVTTPEGIESVTAANRHGETASRSDGLGNVTSYSYDRSGRLVKTTTPLASDTTTFDAAGRVESTRDANGTVVAYTYDAADRVKTRTVDPDGLGLQTSYAYDGRDVRVTDPLGVVTLTRYDKKGRVATQVVDEGGLNLTTTYSYNPADQVLSVTGPGGVVTRHEYDTLGRLAYTIDPLRAVTKYSYDANGNRVGQVQYATALPAGAAAQEVATSSADRQTWWAYDAENRMVFEVNALLGVTEQAYDLAGNLVRTTAYATAVARMPQAGLAGTEAAIRNLLRPSQTQDRTTQYAYDADGRQVRVTDAMGAITTMGHDAAGNVVRITQHAKVGSTAAHEDDRITRHVYDAAGRAVYTIQPGGEVQKVAYAGTRVAQRVRYALVPTLATADLTLAGIHAKVKDDSGAQVETYTYDAAGRQLTATDAMGQTETSTYDQAGNRTSFTNKKGDTWTYGYDKAGRMTEERSPSVVLAGMSSADGMAVSSGSARVITRLAYDTQGNLVSRTEAAGRPEERITTYTYDLLGRQVGVHFGTAQVYDAAGDPLTTTGTLVRQEQAVELQTRTFYDLLGNAVANYDVTGALSQKTYDQLGRVTYEVDALGYVTGYARNTFGEVRVLTRYAQGTSLEARTVNRAGQAVTADTVEATLAAADFDHANDRTLTTSYDQAGRAELVQERSAAIFDPTAAEAQWRSERKTTRTGYNAFGEVVSSESLRNTDTDAWALTTHYYDANGRQRASVDASGYLTERRHDAFGNLASVTEFANAVTSRTATRYTRGAASLDDRTIEYVHDKNNRKTHERRVDVEYSTAADGTTVRGNIVTRYEYDAVGNLTAQIDALGRYQRTYYDALGRVSATLLPNVDAVAQANTGDGIWPLVRYLRDAHGNVVWEMRRANGASAATASGYTEGAADEADRLVRTRYDRLGRAIQVLDARGNHQFFSHDAAGRVAKRWQALGDGTDRSTYEVNVYNKLGQLTSVRRPGTTMQVQGGITARWVPVPWTPSGVAPPPNGADLQLGWTGLEGTRVRVEVTYTTVAYSLYGTGGTDAEEPTPTSYPARTLTVTQERTAAQAPGGMTVAFPDSVSKINQIRVWELIGTDWVVRWQGSYLQAQGSGLTEVDQGVVEETVTQTRYNGFGEATARIVDGAWVEYFHYDAAGRLWRTNTEDGVDKIYLYDAQGNRTSEIRSSGSGRSNADLKLLETAGDAHRDATHRRTDFLYDAAGRLVQKTDANRLDVQGGLVVRDMTAGATVLAAGQPVLIPGYSGDQWAEGQARVKLSWTNLTALGSGDVKVKVTYRTADTLQWGAGGLTTYQSDVFESHEAAQGLTLSWTTKPVAAITEITVSKKNANGTWTEVIRQAPGGSTTLIDLDAASNRLAPEYLYYRKAGSSEAWLAASLADFGDRTVWFASGTLAAGKYDYRIGVVPQGQEERETGNGSFTVAADGTLSAQPTDNVGNEWQRPVVKQKLDRWGNVLELSDPRSADWKTVYAYNANNQMVMQRLPSAGGLQGASNPTTRIYYDALGRQVAVRDARDALSRSVYDAAGNLVREVRADGGAVTHRYNAFGDKVQTTDAMGNVQRFAYDKGGNLVEVNKGSAQVYTVTAQQELLDPVVTEIKERWTYDALGRKTAHINGENEKTAYRYDLLGNVIQVTQPLGQKTFAAFDTQGRKIAEVDANGYEATWRYDYFGRLLGHTDIGGATYRYSYDNARQLLTQTNSRGQNLAFQYDAAGQLSEILDTQAGMDAKRSTYVYDLGGRRLVEKTVAGGVTYQDNRLAYDAQGRLRDVADTRVRLQMAYDANGNRTSVTTTLRYEGLNGEAARNGTRHFQYDAMNRQTVVDALDAQGTMGADTHVLTYDKNGNRVSDLYKGYSVVRNASGAWAATEAPGLVLEAYTYDALNRLRTVKRDEQVIDVRAYDAADRVLKSGNQLSGAYLGQLDRLVDAGHLARADIRINRYDANGRLLHQSVKKGNNEALQEISWDPSRKPREVAAWLEPSMYADGYDHAGNVKGYTVFTHQGNTTTKYSTTFKRFEGYAADQNFISDSSGASRSNREKYDANGQLIEVQDNHLTGYERTFVNDAEGRALYALRGGHVQRQLIVNGEVLGRYGVGVHELAPTDGNGLPNFTNVADFNFSFAPVSPSYPAPSPGAYIVQVGDTLQSVAKGAYGDAALWYRIAEANGLSSNDDVRVGQVLNIPNRVGTIHNNDGTFKPYDPSRITGDVTPHLPLPGERGCGAAGQVLMVVVAVAVTAMTGFGGAFVGAIEAALPTALAFAAPAVAGAAAGALGGLAGQAAGLATGAIDKFDWKGVALSAVGGAVAGALPDFGIASKFLNAAAKAATASVVGQGIGTALGLQKRFSWTSVAASAVGGAVGELAGEALNVKTQGAAARTTENLAKTALKGLISGVASNVARGGKLEAQLVLADAFGNALGQSLAENAKPQGESLYSLSSGDDGVGLRAGGSGLGLSYGGRRATETADGFGQQGQSSTTPSLDAGAVAALRENLGLPPDIPDQGWLLAAGPSNGRSLGGYGPALPIVKRPLTQTSADSADNSSAVLGATAGVAASFGKMALGAARVGSNLIMQTGDLLTGGLNHDHPVMQQVWAEQRALGEGVVNLLGNPIGAATDLIEGVVNRYDAAMSQPTDFDRSYQLGGLFNDVGQGAVGTGLLIRGAARFGAVGLEYVGENAFTGPLTGGSAAQIGAINLRGLDPATRARILERFRSGNEFEAQARAAMDVRKNFDRVYGSGDLSGKYAVPDSMRAGIVEIKDVRELSKDLQFQLYEQSQKRIELVISPRTEYISRPLIESVRGSGGSISVPLLNFEWVRFAGFRCCGAVKGGAAGAANP